MKRFTSLLLVTLLFFNLIVPIAATVAGNTIQPRWNYFDSVNADLDINWLGVAYCSGEAVARDLVTVKAVVRLQQLEDAGWTTINSWSAIGSATAFVEANYAIYRGYTYRVVTTAYVYDDNGNILETASTSETCIF